MLEWAVRERNDAVAVMFINRGLKIFKGPLTTALSHGNEALARLMVERGVYISARTVWEAADSGLERIVQLLLERGAIQTRNPYCGPRLTGRNR